MTARSPSPDALVAEALTLWSALEVKTQAQQSRGQVDIWEAIAECGPALPYCPCCEGGGWVPSASGLTDERCSCWTLDGNDRVILRGRADTLASWERTGEMIEQREQLLSRMVHLVAGCSGPCRGNSATVASCVL